MFFYKELLGPSIITSNLIFNLDAANNSSYPGSGTTWTSLVNNVSGILGNGPTYDSGNLGSLQFDGVNDYCDVSLNSVNLYCFDIWMYNNYDIPNNDTPIYQALAHFGGGAGIYLGGWTQDAVNEAIHIWSGVDSTYNRQFVAVGWHNLVFNWNGSTYDIWVDGVKTTVYPRNNYSHSSLIQNLNTLRVGGRTIIDPSTGNSINYYFNGKISVVKAYNASLTDSEVVQNFNAIKDRYNI